MPVAPWESNAETAAEQAASRSASSKTITVDRITAEIKRRTNVVGIFPNDASIVRLVGASMLEQNYEGSRNRRYMQLEGLQAVSDAVTTRPSAVAR